MSKRKIAPLTSGEKELLKMLWKNWCFVPSKKLPKNGRKQSKIGL